MADSRRYAVPTRFACAILLAGVLAPGVLPQQPSTEVRLAPADGFDLQLLWKRTLGSGYSGIAVADDLVITMFSDGSRDWVIALTAKSGKEQWRRDLGSTFRGQGGSENGPSSTPVVDRDTVYALGPSGNLLALRVEDGSVVWSVRIDRVANARSPVWGFVTKPVVEGELVIVQTGGPDPYAVTAFEKATGALRWSTGGDPMAYQSPAALTLAGVRQVVVISNEILRGLLPSNGEQLWSYSYGQRDFEGAVRLLQVSDDSFLLTPNSNGSWWSAPASLYRLRRRGGALGLEKVWSSRFLKNSYAVPVLLDGYLYGFNSGFLSCVDLDTGDLVWRSRPPGGRDLARIGRTLLVLAPSGDLVAVAATPEGYRETARVPALASGGFAPPVGDAGRVFVRNHQEIAAIGVAEEAAVAMAEAPPLDPGGLTSFLESVERSSEKEALVDEFMDRQQSFPIVEDDGRVHFVYRGPARDVAILGTMTDLFAPDPLQRVGGTDLFYRSYRFERASRWEYFFEVDYDQEKAVVDPLNPRKVRMSWGEASELLMPGWNEPAHLAELPAPRGTIESFTFSSAILHNERQVRVYLPPGYVADSYPLLLVNGLGPLERGSLTRTLDHLIGDKLRPVIVAFVAETPRPVWYDEYVGDLADELATALAQELVPVLERRYRILDNPDSRAILGVYETAQTALYSALRHPHVFGRVALQAVRLLPPVREEVLTLIGELEGVNQRYYVDWNRLEYRDSFYSIDYTAHSRDVYRALEEAGKTVMGGEVPGGGGWRSIAARNDAMLRALFSDTP